MKKVKGFTLVELLVVIAIIALLLAVLMPSLNKARELAQRIVCSNHQKTLGTANIMYANENDQSYCPVYYLEPNSLGKMDRMGARYDEIGWVVNRTFRKILNIDMYGKDKRRSGVAATDQAAEDSSYNIPKEFLCPSDKISTDVKNMLAGVLCSYGYNITDWAMPGEWKIMFRMNPYMGHKADKMLPAKYAFLDAIDWWVVWKSADYKRAWDRLGQASIKDYREKITVYGPVLYRHNEGSNVGFYDGHVKYMKKQQLWVESDREPHSDTYPRRAGGWVVNMDTYILNGQD